MNLPTNVSNVLFKMKAKSKSMEQHCSEYQPAPIHLLMKDKICALHRFVPCRFVPCKL